MVAPEMAADANTNADANADAKASLGTAFVGVTEITMGTATTEALGKLGALMPNLKRIRFEHIEDAAGTTASTWSMPASVEEVYCNSLMASVLARMAEPAGFQWTGTCGDEYDYIPADLHGVPVIIADAQDPSDYVAVARAIAPALANAKAVVFASDADWWVYPLLSKEQAAFAFADAPAVVQALVDAGVEAVAFNCLHLPQRWIDALARAEPLQRITFVRCDLTPVSSPSDVDEMRARQRELKGTLPARFDVRSGP